MYSASIDYLKLNNLTLRKKPHLEDISSAKILLLSTGVFYPREIEVALELIEDRLNKHSKSEYCFIFADRKDETVGYICYGHIIMTEKRFDIYWMVVKKDMQFRGIGGLLLCEAEKDIIKLGGKYIFIETSSRDTYKPARNFYRKYGYLEVARIPYYFAKNDDKIIFIKNVC